MATRTDDVVREALLRRLPAAGDATQLLIVAAPGGWGKSTLLDTWDTWASDVAFCTYAMGKPDNDPTRFIGQLLETAAPIVGNAPQAWPGPGESTPMVWVEETLPLFLDALTDASPVTLVLDDYHVVDNPETHGVVQSIVEAPTPGMLTVLSTRVDPPLRLGRLRAARAVTEVRSDDLRFTEAEADVLLRHAFDLDLSADQVGALVRSTEGWPAAISLAAQSLRTVDDADEFLARFVSSDRLIVDYLTEELLDGLPATHRTFLHDTSVVDDFVPDLADVLTDASVSAHMGEDLERHGLLRRRYDADRVWFRYHPLLRDVLYQRLHPDHKRALHTSAADWFIDDGEPGPAIEHLIAAGEPARAGALIAEHAHDHVLHGRYGTVNRWIADLTAAAEVPAGLLLLGAQAATFGGRVERARELLATAESVGGLSPMERILATAEAVNLTHADGRIVDATSIATELADQIDAATDDPEADAVVLAECAFTVAICSSLSGDLDRAERWLDRCIALTTGQGSRISAVVAIGTKAIHAYLVGDEPAARAHTECALALAADQHLPRTAVHMATVLMADVLVAPNGEPEALEDLRKIVEYIYSPYAVVFYHMVSARHWLASGHGEAAAHTLATACDLAAEIEQPSPLIERYLTLLQARMPATTGTVTSPPGPAALTDRELQVLRAFSSNLTQREIGRELFLSFNTIKTYARSAYRKLGVSSRSEAVRVCRDAGVF